jgi:iron complex outermembrane receptor protein
MAAAGAAHAQATIEELVVTAEKREQNLQDVPVAVSAFTADTREKLGILNVQDLTYFTPGMQYSNALDRVTVRGIGRLTNNLATEGGVAVYYDGIYTSSTTEAARSPLFIARTEVLRGPQGTLYGRNSIGGAINIISKRPDKEFGGEIRATIASFERTDFEGRLSVPVAENLRFSFGAQKIDQKEGYFRNYSGLSDEGGVTDLLYYEVQAEAELGEKVDVWARYSFSQYENQNRFGTSRSPYDRTRPVPATYTVPAPWFGLNVPHTQVGTFQTNPGVNDLRGFNTDTTAKQFLKDSHNLTVDVTYHMDTMDLRYVAGMRSYFYDQFSDYDGSPVTSYVYPSTPFNCLTVPPAATDPCRQQFSPAFAGITIFPSYVTEYVEDKQWWSHEVNLSSTTDGPLQWIVGAYYYYEDVHQPLHIPAPNQPQFANNLRMRDPLTAFTSVPSPYNNSRRDVYYVDYNLDNWSKAVFGQVDYEFNDQWRISAGIRYTADKKKAKEESFQTCWLFAGFICTPNFNAGVGNDAYGFPVIDSITPAQAALNNSPVDWQGTFITPNEASGLGGAAAVIPGQRPGVLEDGVLEDAYRDPRTFLITRHLARSWSATTGTASVEWKPNEDILTYLRYSKGYKAGGFNAGSIQAYPATQPEKVDAFELGAKWNWGTTFQLNAAAFYYDYANMQVPITVLPQGGGPGQTLFFNVPEGLVKGVEIETIWSPIENFTLRANYALIDPTIEEGCCFVDPNDPDANEPGAKPAAAPITGGALTGATIGQDMAGNRLPNQPRHKAVVNGSYVFNLAPGDLTLSATYAWKGETYYSIFNRHYNLADSYGVWDFRATWNDADDRYSIVGYVRNATDELVIDGVSSAGNDSQGRPVQNLTILEPRTYGIQLQYRF